VVSVELLPAAALSESGNGLRLRCIVLTGKFFFFILKQRLPTSLKIITIILNANLFSFNYSQSTLYSKLSTQKFIGQPKRLLKVHWFRNGNHFASTPNYYFPTNEDTNEEINELALSNLTENALQANYSCSGYNGINRFGPISASKALRTFTFLNKVHTLIRHV
jgi:hypothetical protein